MNQHIRFGINHIFEQLRLRQACANVQIHQNLPYWHSESSDVDKDLDQNFDLYPNWIPQNLCLKEAFCMQ